MKRYIKESIILLLQIIFFYISPLFTAPDQIIGLIFLITLATGVLSLVMGLMSKEKIKFIYPILTAVLFIPTIFIHYNNSALIYIAVYFIISSLGVGIGTAIRMLFKKLSTP